MHFENQVIAVTGAAKGIGAATAHAFFRQGAKLALVDVDESAATLAAAMGERARYFQCDVAKSGEVKAAFQRIVAEFGDLSVLVNNAGVQTYGTVTETTEEDWDRTINVNLKSQFLCAKYAIPSMLKRGRGVVVNLSSVQAFVSQNKVAAYTTSKTAILGLTRSIAVDYAPHIRCVAICPGTVDTPMLREAIKLSPNPAEVLQECHDMHPVKRVGTPEEIAELILFCCSESAGFITGQLLQPNGGQVMW